MLQEDFYTVSEIAAVCSVSARQLRNYDKLGIIQPYLRDQKTGYRYYSVRQVPQILMVKEMQKLGFSLMEIGSLLKDEGIEAFRLRIEEKVKDAKSVLEESYRRFEKLQNLYFQITKVLRTTNEIGDTNYIEKPQIFLVMNYPELNIVSKRYSSHISRHDSYALRRAEIIALIEKYHIKITGAHFTIFHDHADFGYTEENRDLEAGVPIGYADSGCPNIRRFGGFKCVSGIHFGSYDFAYVAKTYQAIKDWARERGLVLAGPAIEEYLIGPTLTQNPQNYITRVYFPLKKQRNHVNF